MSNQSRPLRVSTKIGDGLRRVVGADGGVVATDVAPIYLSDATEARGLLLDPKALLNPGKKLP